MKEMKEYLKEMLDEVNTRMEICEEVEYPEYLTEKTDYWIGRRDTVLMLQDYLNSKRGKEEK